MVLIIYLQTYPLAFIFVTHSSKVKNFYRSGPFHFYSHRIIYCYPLYNPKKIAILKKGALFLTFKFQNKRGGDEYEK
jgi:hypothetical protein